MSVNKKNGVVTTIGGPIGYIVRDRCNDSHIHPSSIVTQIMKKVVDGERIGSWKQEVLDYQSNLKTVQNFKKRLQTAYNTIERVGGMVAAKKELDN